MVIILLLFTLGVTSFFVPQKYMKWYFVLSGIVLSSLLFFYVPPVEDDLSRYYQMFDVAKKLSIGEYFGADYGTDDWLMNHMFNDYAKSTPVFFVMLFLISRAPIREMLPVVFSLITYIPLFMLVYEVSADNKYSKRTMCFCFIMILTCIDFRFVSCLRNLSAYSIFAYTLYKDTMRKSKPISCLIGYLIACGIHLSCVPLLFLRLIAILISGKLKWAVVTFLLLVKKLSQLIAPIFGNLFGNITLVAKLIEKIEIYFVDRTNYNVHGALFFCGAIMAVLLVYFASRSDKIALKTYKSYDTAFLYIAAFTVGCVGQYDILTRNTKLLVMLIIPFASGYVDGIVNENAVKIPFSQRRICRDKVVLGGLILLVTVSFLFYSLYSYLPISDCF